MMFSLIVLTSMLLHSCMTAVPTTARTKHHHTAPPLVLIRQDHGFVWDAKEDWWAYLSGLIGISFAFMIVTYVLYNLDLKKLWIKEEPLLGIDMDNPSRSKYNK